MPLERDEEGGVSLVEVAVAIVVLGILLVAFLPVLYHSVQLAVQNQGTATANRLLSSELDAQRESQRLACTAAGPDEEITSPAGGALPDGMTMTKHIVCSPDDKLATITVRVLDGPNVVTQATTKAAVGI